jgi:hypothetical protein
MIGTELGHGLNRAIAGVKHSNGSAARLRIDKASQIVQLGSDLLIVSVIDDDREL